MYRPVLVTPPASMPLTLEEVKAQLDIPYPDKDALILGLIAAATSLLDGWTGHLKGRCLVEQEWRQDFDGFAHCLRLPLLPVISIASVTYDDWSGTERTVDPESYALLEDDQGAFVRFETGFLQPVVRREGPALRVTYKAGYANSSGDPPKTTVPAAIRHGMLMLIRHWFDNPSAVNVGSAAMVMPLSADALLSPWRRIQP